MAGKARHDYQAIGADYRAGLSQAEIALKHGTTNSTVVRAVGRVLGEAERESLRRRRLFQGAAKKAAAGQSARIARGDFMLEERDGLLFAHAGGLTFTFDLEARPILERFGWQVTANRRLIRQMRHGDERRNVYVYHDILGVVPSRAQVVDHINRDPTDNRRVNLRVCSYSDNALNRGPRIAHAARSTTAEEHDRA